MENIVYAVESVPASSERMQLLRHVQEAQFSAIELNLYLDTHPDDRRALAMYNQCHLNLHHCKKEYEQRYGPLLNFGLAGVPQGKWCWIDEPWPWECAD